jgi:hypothetical protein
MMGKFCKSRKLQWGVKFPTSRCFRSSSSPRYFSDFNIFEIQNSISNSNKPAHAGQIFEFSKIESFQNSNFCSKTLFDFESFQKSRVSNICTNAICLVVKQNKFAGIEMLCDTTYRDTRCQDRRHSVSKVS